LCPLRRRAGKWKAESGTEEKTLTPSYLTLTIGGHLKKEIDAYVEYAHKVDGQKIESPSFARLWQGLRVHHLANLGGLVAIAGLDREPPDLLLGGLLELAVRLPDLPATRRAAIASAGREKLDTRATSKRAWKAWSRSKPNF